MDVLIEYDHEQSFKYWADNSIKITHDRSEDAYYLIALKQPCKITKDEYENLMQIIESQPMPILPNYAMGLDGETFSLKFSRGFNSVSFVWWSKYSGEQWQPLLLFRDKLIALKNKYLIM